MIHIEGNDANIGKCSGMQLMEEACKAVIAVYEVLKSELPENIPVQAFSDYYAEQILEGLKNYRSEIVSVSGRKSESSNTSFDKAFGDLFDK